MQSCQGILLETNLMYTEKHTERKITGVQTWNNSEHTDPPEQMNTPCLAKLILLSASTD